MTGPEPPTPSPTTPAAVELAGVRKRFDEVDAVAGVNLAIADGELLALVGPSGCGKSTLLRLIAGLAPCDAGEVRIRDEAVDAAGVWRPPERRRVGIVFQDHTLFPHLSVADNVAFGLKAEGVGARRRQERVGEVLDLVAMRGFEARYPHELSGGEQQRVALARALAPDPEMVLLDEPFSDLDRGLRGQVRTHTVEALEQAGTAALFVTHDHEEALAVGHRVAVMRAGRLEQTAGPSEVFHTPRNRFVATFVGEADFLPAERREGTLLTEAGAVSAPPVADGGPLEVMVRPHEIAFKPDPTGPDTIVGAEFRGGFILYTVQLPSAQQVRSLRPHTEAQPVGARGRVRVDHGHLAAVFCGHEAAALPDLDDRAGASRAG
jgi:iron(III) transport system ATP-binding protein